MSWKKDIKNIVMKRPFLLVVLNPTESEMISKSRRGHSYFSFTRNHNILEKLKSPTLCLFVINHGEESGLYIGLAKSKRSVATLDTAVIVINGAPIKPKSLQELVEMIPDTLFKNMLGPKLKEGASVLSPKLSVQIMEKLLSIEMNHAPLKFMAEKLADRSQNRPAMREFQQSAVELALAAFGIGKTSSPDLIQAREGADTALRNFGNLYRVVEDNVIIHDARSIEGFSLIESDVTGRAVFQNRDERLEVFTANRGPLEKMLGVDLIYINTLLKNAVMVQYKMLEREESATDDERYEWVFRPDKQFQAERDRMKIPDLPRTIPDYRLNDNPFYFKFVKRFQQNQRGSDGFIVSLEHLNFLFNNGKAYGKRGGPRINYEVLEGRYLRENDLIGLIRSGYIGTYSEASKHLYALIKAASEGNNTIVLAWQRELQPKGNGL